MLLRIFFVALLCQPLFINCFAQGLGKEKKKITAVLEKAYQSDQEVRKAFNACVSTSVNSKECKEARKILENQDSINQQVVGKILDQYGWLTKKQTSKNAGKAFFYVIQHAPLEYQAKYANLVDAAFKSGQINSVEYAYFVDRFKSKQGFAQIYGTQNETDNLGNNYMYPVKNWETMNVSRNNLKLPPLDFTQIPEYRLYPKVIENDTIVLIGHIFDKANAPVPHANVVLDTKVLGQSNEKGFFIIYLKRPAEGTKIYVKAKDKQNSMTAKGGKDFYSIYMQF